MSEYLLTNDAYLECIPCGCVYRDVWETYLSPVCPNCGRSWYCQAEFGQRSREGKDVTPRVCVPTSPLVGFWHRFQDIDGWLHREFGDRSSEVIMYIALSLAAKPSINRLYLHNGMWRAVYAANFYELNELSIEDVEYNNDNSLHPERWVEMMEDLALILSLWNSPITLFEAVTMKQPEKGNTAELAFYHREKNRLSRVRKKFRELRDK